MKRGLELLVLVCAGGTAFCANSGPRLSGDLSHPSNACYAVGAPAEIAFEAKGLAPHERRPFAIGIYDWQDKRIGGAHATIVADAAGTWRRAFPLPTERYGFHRVRVENAGALVLPQEGTCPTNERTYVVVDEPARRPFLAQSDAFFGLHGNAADGTDLMPWLGMRQRTGGLQALAQAPAGIWPRHGIFTCSHLDRWQELYACFDADFRARVIDAKKITWLMPLLDEPGGAAALAAAMRRFAAQARAHAVATTPTRIYEIFWEPDLLTSDAAKLVETARICAEAIHAADPDGLVAGPTFSHVAAFDFLQECLDSGLMRHLDAFAIHPYCAYPLEQHGFVESIRRIKEMVRDAAGRDVPFIGTESGHSAPARRTDERLQLTGQVRAQLILLGEGFWFNCAFYGYDFGDKMDGDYGLCYNLDSRPGHVAWGPKRVAPRPAFAGLAAACRLFDGFRPTCAIDDLGGTALGYAYQNKAGTCHLALWDYGGTSAVQIETGRREVNVADVMGNLRRVLTQGGRLDCALGDAPVYVLDVDAGLWGKDGAKSREAKRREKRAAPPLRLRDVSGVVTNRVPRLHVDVENLSDAPLAGVVETRIRGIPEARRQGRFDVPPHRTWRLTTALPDFTPDPSATYIVETTLVPTNAPILRKTAKVQFNASGSRTAKRETQNAAWKLVGALGQSQHADEEPIDWFSCDWIADDAAGNVYLPGGWTIPAGTTHAVKTTRVEKPRNPLAGTPPDVSAFSWGAAVQANATLPPGGDFVFATKWPDSKLHRVTPDGKEVTNAVWPRDVYAERFALADGALWALAGGATRISENLAAGKRVRLGERYAMRTTGIARAKDGWWLATTQGALFYPDGGEGFYVKRVGGLPPPGALALSKGRVVAALGCRLVQFDLDARADEQVRCEQTEWNWFPGGNWQAKFDAMTGKDGVFFVHETTKDETWRYDSNVPDNAWTQRDARLSKWQGGVPKDAEGGKTPLPKMHGATLVAADGEDAVAYVPARKALCVFKRKVSD